MNLDFISAWNMRGQHSFYAVNMSQLQNLAPVFSCGFIHLFDVFVCANIRQLFSAVFVAFTMASRPPLKVSLPQQIDTNIFILFASCNKVICLFNVDTWLWHAYLTYLIMSWML